MRKLITLLAGLSLLALLTGCSGREQASAGPQSGEKVTLRVAWWGSDYRNEATIQVINMYRKLHPDVEIEFEYSAFNEYWKKLAPSAAGNVLPDIIQMDISYLSQYASLDLLEDLSGYVDNGLIDTSSISTGKLSGGWIGSRLFGFSLGMNALFSYYDPGVLKQHDITISDDWTWEDFEQLGKQLKGTDTFLGTYLTPEQFFAYYLRQYGASLFAKDGSSLGYEDDALFTGYFGMMQRLAEEKLIYAPDIWNMNVSEQEQDPFYQGRALIGWGYSNQFISTVERYGKPLAILPMPGPGREQGMFIKPGMFFSIAKSSKHKEEAARFIDFFVNDPEANKVLKAERGVPVSTVVQEQMKPYLKPEQQQVFDYVEWAERHSSSMDPPEPVGAAEVTNVLRELYDLLLFSRITPVQAAAEFRERANQILAANSVTQE